jgi:S1-C subfamily serine protease/pSer/pThr/pTyr-binding forkhead associated (FHA) protein
MTFRNRGTFCGLLGRAKAHVANVLMASVLTAAALFVTALFVVVLAGSFAAHALDTRRLEPSIYKIYSFVPQGNDRYAIRSGTGFLVSGQRYVVTNFHVVEGGERFFIAFRSGREAKLVEARRVESRPDVDLALLEAHGDLPGAALVLGEYDPEKLSEVVAIGYPGAANLNKELVPGAEAQGVPLTDLEPTATTGVVSRMTFTSLKVSESQTLSVRTVQHSSAINPGNSGGPLFDACGRVLGVNTLQGTNSQGLFFSVHADEVGRFLRDLAIPFESSASPCSVSAPAPDGALLAMGLIAALALGAALVLLRSGRARAWLGATPKAVAAGAPGHVSQEGRTATGSTQRLASGDALCLRPVAGGAPIRLDETGRPVTIGRGPAADITVASDTVSKVHARLAFDRKAGRIRFTDLNSSNGTFLDGVRIAEAEAAAGAIVRFGAMDYRVAPELPASPSQTAGRAASGWMLSGFDPSGRAVQFELRPARDPDTGLGRPATWTIGRDPRRADVVIDDGSVSALHAEIAYDPEKALTLRDMQSTNGTRLDGEGIGDRTVALDGAGHEIAVGLAALRLSRLGG